MSRPRKTVATTQKAPTVNQAEMRALALNSLTRSLTTAFPAFFGGDAKHSTLYRDFGYPESLAFANFYQMYERNGLAKAGINRPIETCWQEFPSLQEKEDTHEQTALEKQIADGFERLGFWAHLSESDKFSRIGEYSGVIFRYRDNKTMDQPVDRVGGGLDGIAEVIPALQGQLSPSEFYTDATQENYGQVKMWLYNENGVQSNSENAKIRNFMVHPDRVHVWSLNGSIYGDPVLKAGFNDLLTIQKIIGSGGEGFWKNAKAAPILTIEKDAPLNRLAAMLGTDEAGLADKLDEVIGDWQKGYDQMLALQGITADTINVTLPDPEQFFLSAAQSFAASLSIPLKILIGSQSGERASTEDAKEWNKTCNSRRTNYIKPNIMRMIREKFVRVGILPDREWYLLWGDLTEATSAEKTDIATKMAAINKQHEGQGDGVIFTPDEIREVMGWKQREVIKPPKRTQTDSKTPIDQQGD